MGSVLLTRRIPSSVLGPLQAQHDVNVYDGDGAIPRDELLRRVVGKVFRVEIKGWCSEFETRDAAGRQAGAHAAG